MEQSHNESGGMGPMDTDLPDARPIERDPAGGDPPPVAPPSAEPDQAERLNRLEAILRQPDAIMEPTILGSLREYVVANGHPQQAVEFLTENYVGYAQMATLATGWLQITMGKERVNEVAETTPGQPAPLVAATAPMSDSVLQPAIALPTTAPLVDAAHAPYYAEYRETERVSGIKPASSIEPIMDEAYFLRKLILQRFNPEKFAGIFSAGGGGAPKWLNALIEDPEGRQLIYTLSARHPNSLLLNFAIQKIIMLPGRDVEVASLGPSLVGYFGVFHRLLAVRLRQAALAGDEATLTKLGKELCKGAGSSQHAYIYAQLMLKELAADNGPWAPRFRRLSQELEAATSTPAAWKMHRCFFSAEWASSAAGWLVSDILVGSSGGAHLSGSAEIIKLHRIYCESSGEKAPPAALVRHPCVIEALLQSLFTPGKQLQSEAELACIGVLSIAVAAMDQAAEESVIQEGSQRLCDQSAVVSVREALRLTVQVAQKSLRDEQLTQDEVAAADGALAEPCCALGVLGMLRSVLTSTEFWTQAYHVHKQPPFLPILFLIIKKQPGLRSQVLTLVNDSLATATGSQTPLGADTAKALVEAVVALAREGSVDEVLEWAMHWSRNAESGLIRQLLFGLLEMAEPPYSLRFARVAVRLAEIGGVRRQRIGSREWHARKPLLLEFSTACGHIAFPSDSLSREEVAYLRDLAFALKN